jgi:hypothetical protein
MSSSADAPLDKLWQEYSLVFQEFDDLTLARWMAQTLGQIRGRAWRLSHPLLGAYRLAAQQAHDRQVWFKRLAGIPGDYTEASCCRAPLLPLLTREIGEGGLLCQHCGETCVAWDELPEALQGALSDWYEAYRPVHDVAHWEESRRRSAADYEQALEEAAREAELLLARAGRDLAPALLDFYPALVWEDQDECLEVRPEDIEI